MPRGEGERPFGEQTRRGDPAVDNKERLPFHGRVMLGFGATGGTGAYVAHEFIKGGGHIVAVTSRPDDSSLISMREQLVADLGIPGEQFDAQVELDRAHLERPHEVTKLLERQYGDGKVFTDVMLFPAGGIEKYGLEFGEALQKMKAALNDKEKLDGLVAQLNDKLAKWHLQYYDEAVQLNLRGPVHALQEVARFNAGKVRVNWKDLNSSFGFIGDSPHFYGGERPGVKGKRRPLGVLTKHLKTQWYDENAQWLDDNGIQVDEVVAPLISDSRVGRIIRVNIVPIYRKYDPELAQFMLDTSVDKADVATAMKDTWNVPPGAPNPRRIFVSRRPSGLYVGETWPEELNFDFSKAPF